MQLTNNTSGFKFKYQLSNMCHYITYLYLQLNNMNARKSDIEALEAFK